jgi:hypothetical protein
VVVTLSFLEGVGLIRAENSPPSRPAIRVNIIISFTSSKVPYDFFSDIYNLPRLCGAYSCQILGTFPTINVQQKNMNYSHF